MYSLVFFDILQLPHTVIKKFWKIDPPYSTFYISYLFSGSTVIVFIGCLNSTVQKLDCILLSIF